MNTAASSTICSTRHGHERMATIREEMQKTLEQSAGIYRTGTSLRQGVDEMSRLRERSADLVIEDHSRTFNTERVAALELSFMLDVAQAIVSAAVRREESRGAHQRIDFPKRDDERFLAHSLVSPNRGWLVSRRLHAGDDHPLAAWRARLWGGRITCETASCCR